MENRTLVGVAAIIVLVAGIFFVAWQKEKREQEKQAGHPVVKSETTKLNDTALAMAINNLATAVRDEGKETRHSIDAIAKSQGHLIREQSATNALVHRATWKPPKAPPAEEKPQKRIAINRKPAEKPVTRYVYIETPKTEEVTPRVYSSRHAEWTSQGYTASWDNGPGNPPTYTKRTVSYSCASPVRTHSANCASPNSHYAPRATYTAPYYRSSWIGPFGVFGGSRTISGGSLNTQSALCGPNG